MQDYQKFKEQLNKLKGIDKNNTSYRVVGVDTTRQFLIPEMAIELVNEKNNINRNLKVFTSEYSAQYY